MRILLSFVFTLIGLIGYSQNYDEILRYSQLNPSGTARVIGVGGSFGAMGGDFGGISINPAAIGNYWLSEFSFSPSVTFLNTDATLAGASTQNKVNLKANLDHIGITIASSPWADNWETSSWSFGYNRIANYNESFVFEGQTAGSIVGRYLEQSQGLSPDQLDDFEIGLAYDVGAIYDPDASNFYAADFDPYNTAVNKKQTVERSGGMSEIVLGWGGNFKRKLNIGASLSIPFIRFRESKLYEERDELDEIETFNALTFSERVTTTGVGIKASAGATLKVNKRFRIGAAYHSKTYFALQDSFNTVSYYAYTFDGNFEEFDSRSPDGIFEYGLNTPSRTVASVGYLFRNNKLAGFINADIEMLNYANSAFNLTRSSDATQADADYEDQLNDQIAVELGNAFNFRLGTEIAYGHLRFRAGAALNQSPFSNGLADGNTIYATGVGYKGDSFYIDAAVRYTQSNQTYIPYLMENAVDDQLVDVNTNRGELILTAGWSF